MTNINLNYYGGSGGFLSLWLLLLSTDFKCMFDLDEDISDIKNRHWNISKVDEWKFTEVWPNNKKTKDSDLKNKIFYFCNPTHDEWRNQITSNRQYSKTIIVYTDIDTQLHLSRIKRAGTFFDAAHHRHQNLKSVNDSFINSYNNIKDVTWPVINDINDFGSLNKRIQDETKSMLGFDSIEDFAEAVCPDINKIETPIAIKEQQAEERRTNSFIYNGRKVAPELKDKIYNSDINVLLQDIIHTNGNALLNPLGFNTTKEGCDFIKFWINLHPEETQKILIQ